MCGRPSIRLRFIAAFLSFAAVRYVPASELCTECDDDAALSMSATYSGEAWRQMSGGVRTGTSYLDNLDLTLDVDGERLFGWTGIELFAYALYNNGHTFCDRLAGSMQCVSNIEASRAARMFELWGDWSSTSQKESLRFGLYDVNSEFDSIEAAQIFINPSQGIGPDFAQSGRNGPSIFPVTSLGLRGKKAWDALELKLAVLDAVPGDPEHPSRTAIQLSSDEGALVVAELDRRDPAGSRIAAGYWRYTARFDGFESDSNSVPKQQSSAGAYFLLESAALLSAAEDDGFRTYARFGWAEPKSNAIERYLGTGLTYRIEKQGLERSIGLAVGIAELGEPYRRAQRLSGMQTRKREYCYEFTARWALSDRWVIQPDLQYIDHPGMDASLRASWIAGLRVEVNASGSR
jgi:porin